MYPEVERIMDDEDEDDDDSTSDTDDDKFITFF